MWYTRTQHTLGCCVAPWLASVKQTMIYDSSHWKDELLETATRLESISVRRRPSEKLLVEFEKTMFLAAYVVRKLMDAKCISTDKESCPIPVRTYRAIGKPVTLLNWHRITDHYDLETPCDTSLPLRDVCNQLIHSYVFLPLTASKTGPVRAVLISSDRERNRQLYELGLAAFAEILRGIGEDYPACAKLVFDRVKADYEVRAWTPAK
jgi:hypothetical protein